MAAGAGGTVRHWTLADARTLVPTCDATVLDGAVVAMHWHSVSHTDFEGVIATSNSSIYWTRVSGTSEHASFQDGPVLLVSGHIASVPDVQRLPSHPSHFVSAGGPDGSVRLWSLEAGADQHCLQLQVAERATVNAVAVEEGSLRVAAG